MSSSTGETTGIMLPELYIDNFDNEQIFQQLEMFNNHSVKEHRRVIKALQVGPRVAASKVKSKNLSSQLPKHAKDDSQLVKKQVRFGSNKTSDLDADDSVEEELEAESNVDSEDETALQKLLDSMSSKKTAAQSDDMSDDMSDDIDENDDEDSEASDSSDENDDIDNNRTMLSKRNRTIPKQKNLQASAVDDRFFKLAEMEAFLDEQDLKEQREHSGGANKTEDDSDYDVDYDLSADDKVVCVSELANTNGYNI